MSQAVEKKPRPRGGASLPCTECGGRTEVVITRRIKGQVVRVRKCMVCETTFTSGEKPLPS
jgi:transcriptional regulator NrdR family protein